jgi:hypothetical protein
MAGREPKYDKRFRADTEQVVEKELRNLCALAGDRQEVARQIARRVLGLVGKRLGGTPMTFAEIEAAREEAEHCRDGVQQPAGGKEIEYLAGDTRVHLMNVTPVTSQEMKRGLKELVELGVLRMGMRIRCPRCRLKDWFRAEELRQAGECRGCGSPMPLAPETPWSYHLNPLVQHCVSHRDLAVWQALAGLADRPGSFFFTPSAELYFANPIDGKPKRELDVLCVTGGKLLLGEVKDRELRHADFKDFLKIAAVIRPDRAAIFVSEKDYKPHKAKVNPWRDEFQQQLARLGVRGELHCLPDY